MQLFMLGLAPPGGSQVGTFTIIRPGSVREKAEQITKWHRPEQRYLVVFIFVFKYFLFL